ncbi:hypothetical protein ADICEAN_03202 [Cesiribacter andamanensis AMV16]|uniref:Uncharacterized protein n=1 Tax=Cesiribacter andamanensis AMV16 TaxID=1279009 RepID=M7NIR3_9BACT|nr:hypothetical protein ADICEAN_03202 [Cesiribacter andamanensis AMV16]
MQNGILLIGFLIEIGIQAGQLQAEHPYQLLGGKGRVYHGAQHVEEGLYTQLLADGTYIFHGRVKERGMQKADARFFQIPLQHLLLRGECIAKMLQQVAGAAGRRYPVVTMLGHSLPGSGHHKGA